MYHNKQQKEKVKNKIFFFVFVAYTNETNAKDHIFSPVTYSYWQTMNLFGIESYRISQIRRFIYSSMGCAFCKHKSKYIYKKIELNFCKFNVFQV